MLRTSGAVGTVRVNGPARNWQMRRDVARLRGRRKTKTGSFSPNGGTTVTNYRVTPWRPVPSNRYRAPGFRNFLRLRIYNFGCFGRTRLYGPEYRSNSAHAC